jgi:hypothetical protein
LAAPAGPAARSADRDVDADQSCPGLAVARLFTATEAGSVTSPATAVKLEWPMPSTTPPHVPLMPVWPRESNFRRDRAADVAARTERQDLHGANSSR